MFAFLQARNRFIDFKDIKDKKMKIKNTIEDSSEARRETLLKKMCDFITEKPYSPAGISR